MSVTSVPQPVGTPAPRGLQARAVGIVLSPRETYADVAARPRALGAMLLVIAVSVATLGVFLSTERGQSLWLDRQMTTMEAFGVTVTDTMLAQLSTPLARLVYFSGRIALIPLTALAIAAGGMAIFNVALGGDASFKQIFAVVAHSQIVAALTLVILTPLNYAREALSNPTNVSGLLPMLDDTSFPARLLGSIDLVQVWWIVNLAIGLAVLYKRRTGPIAMAMLGIYALFAATLAGAMTAFSGD